MNAEPSRLAAYADLIAAVLDLRGSGATQAFDSAIAEALESGNISDDLARQLRWLQRASERAIVEHAEAVLPPALVALQPTSFSPTAPAAAPPFAPALLDTAEDEQLEQEQAPVVPLQARRLLVAGLRTLPDPAHRGTLS